MTSTFAKQAMRQQKLSEEYDTPENELYFEQQNSKSNSSGLPEELSDPANERYREQPKLIIRKTNADPPMAAMSQEFVKGTSTMLLRPKNVEI